MKASLFAYIRSLVLPWNAKTGRRIELDGDLGEIRTYNAANEQTSLLNADGFIVSDPNGSSIHLDPDFQGDSTISISGPDLVGTSFVNADIYAGHEVGPPVLPFLNFISRAISGRAACTVFLLGEADDGTSPRFLVQMGGFGNLYFDSDRLYLDTSWIQSDIDVRVGTKSLPRGIIDVTENANNVVLSTTAGTYTTIVTGAVFTPVSGRTYKITFYGGDTLLVAGSGFATTNDWRGKFQVSVNGGAFADVSDAKQLARAPVAQAFRYPVPVIIDQYVAASNQTLQFRFQVAKTSGAATVTSSMDVATNGPWAQMVEDIGVE